METLLSIDPGKSTGITLWGLDDDTPLERLGYWQVEGGLTGFIEWWRSHYEEEFGTLDTDSGTYRLDWTVAEKFVPLAGKGFSHTLDSVEPLRIEGALVTFGIVEDYTPTSKSWQRPNLMYFNGGSTKPEKLKRSRAWLKEHGLLLTGKNVGCKDANDAISSTLHAFAWARRNKHVPTLRHYFGGEND